MPFNDQVDVSELETMNNDIRTIHPVQVKGECSMQGDQIFFSFTIKGEMVLPCARTLVDVPYPFDIKANEVFTTSSYHISEEDEEDEIHPVDGEVIELTPFIKENILLETPYRVFSENAMGNSTVPLEGQDWELVTEEKKQDEIDPRLKKLESLLENKQKEK